jgi:hypothetical protein
MERTEGMLAAVLTVVNTTTVSAHVRLAGALYVKNLIKDAWPGVKDGAPPVRGFHLSDRDVVSFMLPESRAFETRFDSVWTVFDLGCGESSFGESSFGESGFGESGFGESGFGESGFGESSFIYYWCVYVGNFDGCYDMKEQNDTFHRPFSQVSANLPTCKAKQHIGINACLSDVLNGRHLRVLS